MNNEISTKQSPDLSIVVLCYRSGKSAIEFVDKIIATMQAKNISSYEIVLVGNYIPGSDDETPQVVKEIAQRNACITYTAEPKPPKGMMGWDMRSGLNKAGGHYILVIDGDGQMPVEDIIRVYREIKDQNLDFVKTYRTIRGDGLKRKTISLVYNLVFKFLFPGLNSTDVNSKPKIIRRDKFKLLTLKNNGWCIDAEIMIQVRRLKLKFKEIPTTFHGLGGKRKSFVKLPAIFEFIQFLLVYRFEEWRKKV